MARARNIKPSFFQNESLADLLPIERLAFIGLWTVADFNGCIELRPKRLKVQILPYDECDFENIIKNLTDSGFISIYSVQDQHYIKIVNFVKHQSPHKNEREAGSAIPDICESDNKNSDLNKDGKNLNKDGTARAESLLLNPESLLLNPETGLLNPDSRLPTIPPKNGGKAARGSRLPPEWLIPKSWGEWALQERPQWTAEDVRKCADRFRDYWISKTGKDATKADWEATWRNWVRKDNTPANGIDVRYMTPMQRKMAATDKAIDEWLNEGGQTVEGECRAG